MFICYTMNHDISIIVYFDEKRDGVRKGLLRNSIIFIWKTKLLSSSPVSHLVMKIIAHIARVRQLLYYELPTATHTNLYLTLTKKQAKSNKQRTHLLPDHAAGAPKRDLHNKWDGKDR